MKLFYTDEFDLPLPEAHRFPMSKYRRLRNHLQVSSWTNECEFLVPPAATNAELSLVHTPDYSTMILPHSLTIPTT